MGFKLVPEPQFKKDFKKQRQMHPRIVEELRPALEELRANGEVPEEYSPHELGNRGGNYDGHIEFHLSEGHVDVLVIYMPHHSNPEIRLVRMGPHEELFQGPAR